MKLRSVRDADVSNKRVLLRVDFNVPFRDGRVADTTRIDAALPTIHHLLEREARLLLLSHFGNPDGKKKDRYSLEPILAILRERLPGTSADFSGLLPGDERLEAVSASVKPGSALLLENVRFSSGEERNDPELAAALARLADLFVNDAFGAAHRSHASTVGVAKLLPSYAGLLLEREVQTLSRVLESPGRPFVAIIGGAKISTKLKVIASLLKRCDFLLLGGALANTILKAQGVSVGKSLIEESMVEPAKKLTLLDNRLRVPVDVVASTDVDESAPTRTTAVANVRDDESILDIGPDTVGLYRMIIEQAKLVVWNGPMGVFEIERFAEGTRALARVLADSDAETIVGGGETIDAITAEGLREKMSFISTGGGAMLEFLEGETLPALEPLMSS